MSGRPISPHVASERRDGTYPHGGHESLLYMVVRRIDYSHLIAFIKRYRKEIPLLGIYGMQNQSVLVELLLGKVHGHV